MKKCTLCKGEILDEPVHDANNNPFCSSGCRSVSLTLDVDSESDRDVRADFGNHDRNTITSGPEATRTFLRVDGMHNTTSEAFLESVACEREGVTDAEASYITETIRIDYDPEQVTEQDLSEMLSTAGFTAIPRDEAPIDLSAAAKQGERRLDSALGYRYIIGVLFGSFLMLSYVVLVYPYYLSSILGEGMLELFSSSAGFGSGGGVLILPLYLVLTGIVLIFTGLPLLRDAYVSLRMRQPTTELLVSITVGGAYLYSTVAVLLGRADVYYDLALVVTVMVVGAIFYESLVKQRAIDQLADLTISQIEHARLYEPDETTRTVALEELEAGDRILVREGERIPVDGVLADGTCTVDEAVVTGESLPIPKSEGDELIGGAVVTDGAAVIRVDDQATSSIDQLVRTVWELQSAEHGVQRRANRYAAIIIPILVASVVLVSGVHLALTQEPVSTLLIGLTVIIVGSPWALGLAIPLSVASSINEAIQRDIVVFDETIFERLREIDTIVFDKTGTLTTGQMQVIDHDLPSELLNAAAALEYRASHPAATAIVNFVLEADGDAARSDDDTTSFREEAHAEQVREFKTHSTGVEGVIDGEDVLVGNLDLFEKHDWTVSNDIRDHVIDARGFGRLPILVGRNRRAEGYLVVGDKPREQWDAALTQLGERDIDLVVLTGDDKEATRFFSQHPYVTHAFAGVPPTGKTATIRRLQSDQYVTMVGDGTNDAPALSQADLGIALGSGTAIASDAADITITDNDLGKIETAVDLAYAARRRIIQNNGLALLYNGISIPLAVGGLLNPLFAMSAVIITSSLIGMNSMRSLLDQ